MVGVSRGLARGDRPLVGAVATLSAMAVLFGGCANGGPPHPPSPAPDVLVSVSLNGSAPNKQVEVHPGSVVHVSVTMTVGRGVIVSALQLGVLASGNSGLTEGRACGVQAWVFQHQGAVGTGIYHYDTSFVAHAFRDSPSQPMRLAAYITSATPSASEAPVVASYVIAPVVPADESTAAPATPPCT